ncbi:JAB domain-containing protein [Geoalkalibacter halelectricus]|uniref:JAB domain-containing protein n=1 Tax=Geoalkalibacter halelectricus TaxID=2847045 RepID=A0ABY5ZFK5_9BACT|nr:JAB domain-containing protein [Geoalkalibacter halelectricus]MDO3378109.1 JAB domain-containing protein [Geoalkalibacter halelectricus]UWZ77955.1 JAB domain-containing protein [Geoalkalibacter halelectricus]
MNPETPFRPQGRRTKGSTIRLKVIRPVYETLQLSEEMGEYLHGHRSLTTSDQVAKLFSFLQHETRENFWSAHLDSKNRLLCLDLISVGSLSAAIVHPREVFKSCLLSSAAAVVLVHNLCGALHKLCNVKLPVM